MATRGRSFGTVERTVQKGITTVHRLMYDLSGGRLGNTLLGNPIGVLTTTGRKSGQKRETVLVIYPEGNDFIVVASNGGTATPPAWLFNLEANPEASVRMAGVEHPVRAEVMSPQDKAHWWPVVVSRYKGYAGYQEKTDRDIPVVWLRGTAQV